MKYALEIPKKKDKKLNFFSAPKAKYITSGLKKANGVKRKGMITDTDTGFCRISDVIDETDCLIWIFGGPKKSKKIIK